MIQMNLMNIRKESCKNYWEYLKTIGYEHSEGCKVKYKRLKNKINLKKVMKKMKIIKMMKLRKY